MTKAPADVDDHLIMSDVPSVPPSLAASKKKKRKGVAKPPPATAVDDLLDDMAPSLAATAQVQADLLATASDLYRRIEADPHGLPDDEAYWTSLPAHLRTFIRNALPLGQLGATSPDQADNGPRHASTQAMIAVAQQLAQAAHASQTGLSDLYRSKDKFLPPFPGMTMPMTDEGDLVFVNELDDEEAELDPAYASDEILDEKLEEVREPEKKKKSKKKKKKSTSAANANANATTQAIPTDDHRLATAPLPAPLPAPTPRGRSMPPVPVAAPHAPLPSSRAAGKLPMMFHSTATRPPAVPAPRPPMPKRSKSSLSVSSNHSPMFPTHMAGAAPPASGSGLTIGSAEEREKIREFWYGLNRRDRKTMLEAEEQSVRRKLKDYMRHACTCRVCMRKRVAIDTKLCELYKSYYDALEEQIVEYEHAHAAQDTQHGHDEAEDEDAVVSLAALGPGPFPGSIALDQHGGVVGANLLISRQSFRERRRRALSAYPPDTPTSERLRDAVGDVTHPSDDLYDDLDDDEYEDEYDDEYDDDYDDEYERPDRRRRASSQCHGSDCYCINSSLTVKGILTVADDLSGNEVQKLILMMEQLAERHAPPEVTCDVADDESTPSELELSPEEQREQGWRMFQIFAARILEQRVLQAYRERVAQERQWQLLRELEEEESNEKAREAKRAKENQRKKDKKRQLKQQKEEERLRREQEKAAEEAAAREAERKRQEEERQKREAARKEAERKEAERKEAARKEAERKRKEAERREAERKEAERKEAERKEAERKEAEKREERKRQAEERKRRNQERRQRGKREAAVDTTPPPPASAPASAPASTPGATSATSAPSAAAPASATSATSAAPATPTTPPTPVQAKHDGSAPRVPVDRALFSESFAPLSFGTRTTEPEPWDPRRTAPPSRHAPFFDSMASTTSALHRMHLHPVSSAATPGTTSSSSLAGAVDAGVTSSPHGPPHDFGLGSLVAPSVPSNTASPARPMPAPIGPIERPRRSATGSSDIGVESILGSAALGDDELIEPRGRRANAMAMASAFGPPGSASTIAPHRPFYSPWSSTPTPGYSSLGLGTLGTTSAASAAPGSASTATAPPSAAPAPSGLGALGTGLPSSTATTALGTRGFGSAPWNTSWDRARHAFEQPNVDVFSSDPHAAATPMPSALAPGTLPPPPGRPRPNGYPFPSLPTFSTGP